MAKEDRVQVSRSDKTVSDLVREVGEPHVAIRTGLTDGQRFDILVRPAEGRPVLIAVHL